MAAPTVQASNLAVADVTNTSAILRGTRGNGDSCAFWVKRVLPNNLSGMLVDGSPVSGVQTFGNGTEVPSVEYGWFCVGTSEGTIDSYIYGLSPGTTYLVHVTEATGFTDGTPEWNDDQAENNPIIFATEE